jgi:hypothetical protein
MNRRCTFLLPIRRTVWDAREVADLTAYFHVFREVDCELLVIDGSPAPVFSLNAVEWRGLCRHVPVDRRHPYLNGKVNGIHTGVAATSADYIIVGDDDVRCTAEDLRRMIDLLDRYDMVRPQNYFDPVPWWAAIDAARMLINRALLVGADYPGICAFRRETFLAVGPYDGDVLFDNEEIVRHFLVRGATVANARDLLIRKLPPRLSKWLEQRPRQAYEDFVMRGKTVGALLLHPVAIALAIAFGSSAFAVYAVVLALGSIVIAARGRSGAAAAKFPVRAVLAAPLWLIERGISVWVALAWRLLKGGYPFGGVMIRKGTGRDWKEGGRGRMSDE